MKQNVKFYLNPKNFFTVAAAVCMILAAACRCIGIIPQIQVLSKNEMAELLALPVAACLLYAASVAFCGEKNVWLSIIPVIFGAMFFILRLNTNDNISGRMQGWISVLLKLLLYVTVTVIYTATVTGSLRTKFALAGIVFLSLAGHAGMEVYPAIKLLGESLTWSSVLLEAGIIFILLGLLFASLGLKKLAPPDPDAGRKIVPPIPGGGMKVSDPEPESGEAPEPEPETEPSAPESPAIPEPVPVFIEEPEEEAFAEIEPEAPDAGAAEADPDAEPEREAAVPAERLSFAERIGLKKHFIASADADDDMTDDYAEAEEDDLSTEDAEAAETALEDD